jgi:hypothetical protein
LSVAAALKDLLFGTAARIRLFQLKAGGFDDLTLRLDGSERMIGNNYGSIMTRHFWSPSELCVMYCLPSPAWLNSWWYIGTTYITRCRLLPIVDDLA